MKLKNQVGIEIKKLRESLKLSQEAFAEKIQIDVTFLSGIENGHRNITLETLDKIMTALDSNILTKLIPIEKKQFKEREEYLLEIEKIIQEMDIKSLAALHTVLTNKY